MSHRPVPRRRHASDAPRPATVIIGIGNELRGDDAAGLWAVRRLRELAPGPMGIWEQSGEASSLIEAWEGAETAMVMDAVLTGAPAGTIHRFEPLVQPFPKIPAPRSTHALGLAEAVELAQALGRLPERLIVYGIEGRNFERGAEPSPEVRGAVEVLVSCVLRELGISEQKAIRP